MGDQTETTRAPRTRRTVLTGAAAAAVASVLANGRAEAAAGEPVLQGRVNNAGDSMTVLTSSGYPATFRVVNSSRARTGATALVANSGFGTAAFVRTSHRHEEGIRAINAAPRSGGGAAIHAGGGKNDGVVASTSEASRHAILALHRASTAGRTGAAVRAEGGRNDGVVGLNNSRRFGVAGVSTNGTGVSGRGTVGVYGLADAGGRWGVVSDGDALVTGDLHVEGSISGGSLAAESGTVSLDGAGAATVVLAKAGRDYDYQLTAIGAPMPYLHVVNRRDGSFQIAGGKPGCEVSWQRRARTSSATTTTRPDFTEMRDRMRSLSVDQPD